MWIDPDYISKMIPCIISRVLASSLCQQLSDNASNSPIPSSRTNSPPSFAAHLKSHELFFHAALQQPRDIRVDSFQLQLCFRQYVFDGCGLVGDDWNPAMAMRSNCNAAIVCCYFRRCTRYMLGSCEMSNLPADAAEAVDTNVDGHDSIGCFDSSNDEK